MRNCIFTIVSNNYLHYAHTLFNSVRAQSPEVTLVLGLCDKRVEGLNYPDNVEIIELEDLKIPNLSGFIYQYTILELNTAIKPYVMEMLFEKGFDNVAYFDPDIRLFDSLDRLWNELSENDVVLTPHLTDLLDDDKLPSELGILQAGSYNLGFIGLSNSQTAIKLLKWWQGKLYKDCVVDLERGLFVDQKWMDLVPSLFENVKIIRDESWNVAYWNLNHRDITKNSDTYYVNGNQLFFFHYSGYSVKSKTLSKHQNRFLKSSKGKELVELCEIYDSDLLNNGVNSFSSLKFNYDSFTDGVRVPAAGRRLILKNNDLFELDYFSTESTDVIHNRFNKVVKRTNDGLKLTEIVIAYWNSRKDLQEAFPDVYGADALRYFHWLLESKEHDLDKIYIKPIENELNRNPLDGNSRSASVLKVNSTSIFSTVSRRVAKVIWNNRDKIPLFVRHRLKTGMGKKVFAHAFGRGDSAQIQTSSSSVQQITESEIKEAGVTVSGYLYAESGIGEAARCTIKSFSEGNVPFSVVDYRVGNISRMNGDLPSNLTFGAKYNVNVIHVNADQMDVYADSDSGAACLRGSYNIGYWFWELPDFPDEFNKSFNYLDEIWVASEFNRESIAKKTDKPVTLIRPAVDLKVSPRFDRQYFGLKDEDIIYFTMADALSQFERKNPKGAIDAFTRAFGDRPEANVKLLLKLSNLDFNEPFRDYVNTAISLDNRISVIDGYLSKDELSSLTNIVDCYISLHRAEGFGLPIAESMFFGKPVIATAWSGNMEFMNERNSYLVSYELQPISKSNSEGPYNYNSVWAEPSIDEAAKYLLEVYEDPNKASEIGLEAKATIRDNFSPYSSHEAMKARLEVINVK